MVVIPVGDEKEHLRRYFSLYLNCFVLVYLYPSVLKKKNDEKKAPFCPLNPYVIGLYTRLAIKGSVKECFIHTP